MNNKSIKVLLVDDDCDDFFIVKELLANSPFNYDVEWICSAAVAIHVIKESRHDVYLLDYNLGERSGLDVLLDVQGSDQFRPIIMLTGDETKNLDMAALKAGATDYLAKGTITSEVLDFSIRHSMERVGSITRVE